MAEKRNLRHARQKELKNKDKRQPKGFFKALICFAVIAVVVVGGAFLYKMYMPDFNNAVVDDAIYYTPSQTIETVSFKNSFIVNTIDGIRILNRSGEDINEEVANMVSPYVKGMKAPVMMSNDKTALVFDMSGRSAVLFNDAGVVQTYSFSGDIINGKLSNSGHFVFVVEDVGSKAAVKAYSASGNELLTWYSGKGYVTDAAINNSKSILTVVTNEVLNGEISSKILFFTLDNAEPYMGKTIGNSLCTAVSFFGDSAFAVCENGIYCIDKDGESNLAYDFSGKKMKHFKTFENGNILVLSESAANETYDAAIINTKGRIVSEFTVESFLDISDTDKNSFLIIKRKGVISINHRGRIKDEIPCEFEVKDAKYFKDKIAIVSQDRIFFK